MMTRMKPALRGTIAALAMAAAIPLASCNRAPNEAAAVRLPELPATLPLVPGEPTNLAYAPDVEDLPRVAPIQAVRVASPDQYYAYADEAANFSEAIGDAPPDYGFDYDDEGYEPWGWEGYDESMMYVEPLDDGYRYYYYRPGEDEPYFVRDPDYAYGYDDGRLAMIYGPYGDIIPYQGYAPYIQYASIYLVRGRDLYRASHRHRRPVIVGDWASRHDHYSAYQSRWLQERMRQQAWRNYHDRNEERASRYWHQERARRQADMVRYAAWRDEGFRTPPPPRAIPAAWTKARWARDERQFAPPVRGFGGNAIEQRRAAAEERVRFARQAREAVRERQQQRLASAADVRAQQRDARLAAMEQRRAAILQQRQDRQSGPERLQAIRAERQQRQQAGAQAASDRREAQLARRDAAQQARLVRQQQQQARREAVVNRGGAARNDRQAARAEQRAAQQRARAEQQARQQGQRAQVQQRQQAQRAQADARRAQAEQRRAQADQRRQAQESASRAQQQRAASAQAASQRAEARRQAQERQQAERQSRAQEQAARREQARQQNERAAADRAQRQQAQAERQQAAARQAEARQQAQSQRRQQAEQRQQQVQQRQQQADERRQQAAQARAERQQARANPSASDDQDRRGRRNR